MIFDTGISESMVRGMVMPIWYHPLYTEGISEGARFPRERYRILRERLKALEELSLIHI